MMGRAHSLLAGISLQTSVFTQVLPLSLSTGAPPPTAPRSADLYAAPNEPCRPLVLHLCSRRDGNLGSGPDALVTLVTALREPGCPLLEPVHDGQHPLPQGGVDVGPPPHCVHPHAGRIRLLQASDVDLR